MKAVTSWKELHGKDPIWCPGCGDFGVLRAMQKAAVGQGLSRHETALVTGIGCSGNITAYFSSFGYHGIHGRALPVATGLKLANPDLTVLVAGGDGDGFGIGLGHFMHAARRNADVTYVVMDNQVYGLTKGQTSPTTSPDMHTKASPLGPMAEPVNPLELAMAAGATFVAQGFAGDQKALVALLEKAIAHRGFSIVNVQSPCVTYNLVNTYDWFKEHMLDLTEVHHDASDRDAAIRIAHDRSRVPMGILWQEERPPLHERFTAGDRVAVAGAPMAGPEIRAWIDAFRVR